MINILKGKRHNKMKKENMITMIKDTFQMMINTIPHIKSNLDFSMKKINKNKYKGSSMENILLCIQLKNKK